MIEAGSVPVRADAGPAGEGLKAKLSPDGTSPHILVVEDERIVALDLAATLKELGYAVAASVGSGEAAIEQATRLRPDLVLMDIRLIGEMDGIQAAQSIKKELDVPVIYLTAHSDDPTLARAAATGPFGYIVKPFKSADLHCAIEIALHKHEIEAKLRERELWLTTTLKSIGDGVVATDPDHRIKFLNPVAEALTGWSSSEAVGRIADEILTLVNSKTGSPLTSPLRQALLERTTTTMEGDVDLVARSGKVTPIDDSAAPILDDFGKVLGGVMVFKDITDARRAHQKIQTANAELERRVVERTAQLEAANQELESFNYSVAHDLRAPLRGIDGFSAILINSHTANLGPEGLDCLNRIRAGAERMRQLIDDLLYLARVARFDFHRQPVDLTELATQILAELRAARKDREVQVVVQKGVAVEGDRRLLRIVLENLLGNAWKFTGKTAAPKIEFGSCTEEGRQVCYVRDNGVGFEMKYAGKLFAVFQRLHTAEEFEGTGVGLAIVERIIHRHGGRIRAESAPEQGATFSFMV
jgi:two-component system, cell cycle sensor histidine kinase and response regulator CckA